MSGSGNNGDTKGFDTLWGDGLGGLGSDLAYLPGMHFLPANGSHFEATDYIFAGNLGRLGTGWLGRWLDLYGSATNPLQAISIGSSLSKQIRTASAPVCSVPTTFGNFRFSVGGTNVNNEVGRLAAIPATTPGVAQSRSVFQNTVNVSNQLGSTVPPGANPDYPAGSLSDRLKTAATLLSANLGVKIVTIDWGSFDTHGDQAAAMDPQITTLSRALAAFKNDLTARGIEQRVITVVFTEFGRRVGENGSIGTDHGAGGPCFVMGSAVRGGMAGNHPNVAVAHERQPRGHDRLPNRLAGSHRRMARRRPDPRASRSPLCRASADPTGRQPCSSESTPTRRRRDGARDHRRRRVGRARPGATPAAAAPSAGSSRGPGSRHRSSPIRSVSHLRRERRWSARSRQRRRRHRLHPPPPVPLPRTVAVDETEYSIGLSRSLVGAGEVTFNVYNRGMDEHDLALVDANGAVQVVSVPSRESRSLVAQLRRRQVRIYCSLFAGTAASHEALGMSAVIDVG